MNDILTISMILNGFLALLCVYLGNRIEHHKFECKKAVRLGKEYIKSHETLAEIILLVKKHL